MPNVPPLDKILSTLRTGAPEDHGRCLDLRRVESARRQAGGLPARLYAEVKTSADKTLTAPVSKYEKPDGRRLLSVSRLVLSRVSELALASRLENDPRYAARTWKDQKSSISIEKLMIVY